MAVPDDVGLGVPAAAVALSVDVLATLATCRLASVETTHAWNPAHSYASDIVLRVRAPNGSLVTLSNRAGGGSRLIGPYAFVAGAAAWPPSVNPIPAGSYAADYTPVLDSPANGVWQLVAQDFSVIDTGSLSAFSLTLRCQTSPP